MTLTQRSRLSTIVLATVLLCIALYGIDFKMFSRKRHMHAKSNIFEYTQNTTTKFSLKGSTTGRLFSGDVIREMVSIPKEGSISKPIIVNNDGINCKKWAVVTTIFKASDALSLLSKQKIWCIVVIADKRSLPKRDYVTKINSYDSSKHVYLTLKDQEAMFPVLSKITPYNSFARKNLGYMYAILKGAEFIWDFDDDNMGVIDVDYFGKLNAGYVTPCKPLKSKVVNPYFYFGVNETYTWPRGIPLQLIRDPSTNPPLCKKNDVVNIGVLQSLANKQPDVDAVYRLTRDTPFNFQAKLDTHKMFLIPKDVYSPFNAQATLWSAQAFEYLMLPISVNGRVSDIWRSYFTQFFFHLSGNVKVAFTPPFVIQERNVHNYIKDFDAELDIYQKSMQLVEFLSSPKTSQKHTTMKSLYIELFSRGFIEQEDVYYIIAWDRTLNAALKHR